MRPSELSRKLRSIADRIAASRMPSLKRVSAELTATLQGVEGDGISMLAKDPTIDIEVEDIEGAMKQIAEALVSAGAEDVHYDGSDSFYIPVKPEARESVTRAIEEISLGSLGPECQAFMSAFSLMD